MLFTSGREFEREDGPGDASPVSIRVDWHVDSGTQSQPSDRVAQGAPKRSFGCAATGEDQP